MAKIFYSMAGEGRGHATRVRAIVEELRREHQLVLFAPGVAYQYLSAVYAETAEVQVRPIPGLHFRYRGLRLCYASSVFGALPYVAKMRRYVADLERAIRRERPDLAITDFEPGLPRAAVRCGTPLVSFDHQHVLSVSDFGALPRSLQWKAWWLGKFVDAFYAGHTKTIVSSFYFPPLKARRRDAVQVGVLLRREILQAAPDDAGHLLVYLRRFARPNVLEALSRCGREVRIYGLGARPREGNLRFFAVDETGFLDDLATCHALVSNAGNQLVGEALYLRKPVLACPESGNFEQELNGYFLAASGGGRTMYGEAVTAERLRAFLGHADAHRAAIRTDGLCGNRQAVEAIAALLPLPAPKALDLPWAHVA